LPTVNAVQMLVSRALQDTIVTPSIGSGLAVVIYDPQVAAGGILHFLFPDSAAMDRENAENYPCAYADTGLSLFLKQAYASGMQKSNLRIVLVGGAQTVKPPNFLNFGKRNLEAATKILSEQDLAVAGTEVGGHATRTVRLKIRDGAIQLEIRGQGVKVL